MAKKAEEYGSHDKTFIAEEDGEFVLSDGKESLSFKVEKGLRMINTLTLSFF